MKARRKHGTGSIEVLPSGSRRARIRTPSGKRFDAVCETDDEAEGTLAVVIEELRAANLQPTPRGGVTLRGYIPRWLDELELSRTYVAMSHIRSVANLHLLTAPFVDLPMKQITTKMIRLWVKELAKSDAADSSLGHRLSALRKCFDAAVEAEIIDVNPGLGVHIPRRAARTDDPWTYLEPEEQRALLTCAEIPEAWRLQIAIAIGTGIRAGELFNLRREDVLLDRESPEIVVRYGSKKRAPKGRKVRRVPLRGFALDAARRWVQLLPEWCHGKNPYDLWFPGEYGGFNKVSRVPGWKAWLRAAGIRRPVRWHDLRHTCAASLVSGWWGPAWSLQQVQALLGHHSIRETERYAHLAPDALRRAADSIAVPHVVQIKPQSIEIAWGGVSPRHSPEVEEKQALTIEAWANLAHAARVALVAFAAGAPEAEELFSRIAAIAELSAFARLAQAFRAGGPDVADRGVELVEAVLEHAELAELALARRSA